jgi:hypothetical protein
MIGYKLDVIPGIMLAAEVRRRLGIPETPRSIILHLIIPIDQEYTMIPKRAVQEMMHQAKASASCSGNDIVIFHSAG